MQEEVIRVRKGKTFVEEKIVYKSTHHGPLIDDPLGILGLLMHRYPENVAIDVERLPIAVKWSGHDLNAETFDIFTNIAKSKSVAEFLEFTQDYTGPSLSLLLADIQGNIAY